LTSGGHRLRCSVAKQKRTPVRKNRVRNQVLQWAVVGVVGAAILFLAINALTRPAPEPAPAPFLTNAHDDVIGLTRMLGDVVLDSATRAKFPASIEPKLKGPDTLFGQKRWYDALNALQALFGKATPAESVALNAYMAIGFTAAASEDRAVVRFRKVLAKDPTPAGLGPWAAFNAGFLYQKRGFQDSAVAYYSRARDMLSASTGFLRAASLNNLGVAIENLKDPAGAKAAYSEAAVYVDTLTGQKDLKTIRENLARVQRAMPVPKRQ
jgi:tetratricopeptide (TPR) repeat protein